MQNKVFKKVLIWSTLLSITLSLPSFAYTLMGFFIASPETFVPSSDFTSLQITNMQTCAGRWNTAAGETIFLASSSTHNSTNYSGEHYDGKNYIYYIEDDDEHAGRYLGMCYTDSQGRIYLSEFDINMNSYYAWNVSSNNFDFQSVFLHELGHAAGLHHSEYRNAVMYESFSRGELRRTLHSDDNNGMMDIYYWNW